jgi:predicted lipid-binding transport protein (Tim44 family)
MLIDIIILAIVTFFIFVKLNKTIGKIDEDDKISIQQKIQKQKEQLANILSSQHNKTNTQSSPTEVLVGSSNTLSALSAVFPNLSNSSIENLQIIFEKSNIDHNFFLKGAKMTFEIIINNFATGNIVALQPLLSPEILEQFQKAINKRKEQQQSLTTNLIALDETTVIASSINGDLANIVVKFSSRQINYICDLQNKVISGNKDQILNITDNWTFQRNLASPSPAWLVTSTNS